jgi:hypothetical protein
MAIDPTLPPTVEEFRLLFPEFAAIPDAHVQLYLDIAMSWVDTFWDPQDAKLSAMYAAAHYLWIHDLSSGGALSGSGSGNGGGSVGGGVVDPELGKIWIKSVRFRDRSVTYERVGLPNQSSTTGKGSTATDFWEASPYGKMYLSFQRRNVPHVAVV